MHVTIEASRDGFHAVAVGDFIGVHVGSLTCAGTITRISRGPYYETTIELTFECDEIPPLDGSHSLALAKILGIGDWRLRRIDVERLPRKRGYQYLGAVMRESGPSAVDAARGVGVSARGPLTLFGPDLSEP